MFWVQQHTLPPSCRLCTQQMDGSIGKPLTLSSVAKDCQAINRLLVKRHCKFAEQGRQSRQLSRDGLLTQGHGMQKTCV